MDPSKSSAEQMIQIIKNHAADSAAYTGISEFSEPVLEALRNVPRENFVPASHRKFAYEDTPLSIGYGQTISQPFIVALMAEVLHLKKSDRVLEIGSGCGYSAAVFSKLCSRVFTVEIMAELAIMASTNLSDYNNVKVLHRNGYDGYLTEAPFDAITVAAAVKKIPDPLIEQLKNGGRMIIPVENANRGGQALTLIEKNQKGKISFREILPVVFVPFVS